MSASALRINDVSKAFPPATQALDRVSVEIVPGAIHALLGANGSGKSTLVKLLAGIEHADAGELEMHGHRHEMSRLTPREARGLGLRFVHQQPSVFPELSVAENMAMDGSFETAKTGRILWRQLHARVRGLLERYEIRADSSQRLGSLTPATRAMITIVRTLQDETHLERAVLVLDEPTAALPPYESEILLEALRRYAKNGVTILYVTHRLQEVMDAADRATIFRDGRVVARLDRAEFTHGALVEGIVGRELIESQGSGQYRIDDGHREIKPPQLEVRGLAGGPIRGVDLQLRPGEIVGLAGCLGSGCTSLLRMLFGLAAPSAGTIELDGIPLRLNSPRDGMRAGIALVPDDRTSDAVFQHLTVRDNLTAAGVEDYAAYGRMLPGLERKAARRLISEFDVHTSSDRAPVSSLSGGNQQKVILARWLRREPRVLLLDEPTQGVDVGARAEIYELIRAATRRAAAVLVASSDYEELETLCDRVLILNHGQIECEVSGEGIDADHLHELCYGQEALLAV